MNLVMAAKADFQKGVEQLVIESVQEGQLLLLDNFEKTYLEIKEKLGQEPDIETTSLIEMYRLSIKSQLNK